MDISNRSVIIPQEYSQSGIVSKRNMNLLGRSVNDLETRGDMRIDRNPIGGNIFYADEDLYHFKLFEPSDYDPDTEGSTATIKMYWGAWVRNSKYTFSRLPLTTDVDPVIAGNSMTYKTVMLSSNVMNYVYTHLVAPVSPAQNAQHLSPDNKPYLMEAVAYQTPIVNGGDIQKLQESLKGGVHGKNWRLIGLVHVDVNGHIDWVEQCYNGGDIDDLVAYYEGPFKLEPAGYGKGPAPANTMSSAFSTPLYNTNNASTGDPNNSFYPYGESTANCVIVNQGIYQHSGNKQVVIWPSAGFTVADLSSPAYVSNSISIGVVIKLRAPGQSQYDSDVQFNSGLVDTATTTNVWSNVLAPRSQDSFIYTQTIGYAKLDDTGTLTDIVQLTHDDIMISKYCSDFAGYYANAYSATQDQVMIEAGWIMGPYDNYLKAQTTVTLPNVDTEAPVGFTDPYYDLLVYLTHEIDTGTGKINTGTVTYSTASDFRTTGGNHWCDFNQEIYYQKTPIGIARYVKDPGVTPVPNKWRLVDWIQEQRGPIMSHYWTACTASCTVAKHYTGMIVSPYEIGCDATTTTTSTCAAI